MAGFHNPLCECCMFSLIWLFLCQKHDGPVWVTHEASLLSSVPASASVWIIGTEMLKFVCDETRPKTFVFDCVASAELVGFADFLHNTRHLSVQIWPLGFCFPSVSTACVRPIFWSVRKAARVSFVQQERYTMPCYIHFHNLLLWNPGPTTSLVSTQSKTHNHIPGRAGGQFNYAMCVLVTLTCPLTGKPSDRLSSSSLETFVHYNCSWLQLKIIPFHSVAKWKRENLHFILISSFTCLAGMRKKKFTFP